MKAFLKNYRQSPRKVRSVADLVRGKSVAEARMILKHLAKRAGNPIDKLIQSAAANAVAMGREEQGLFVKELRVDKGIVMKRIMPAAMGSAHRINKRTSHVTLVLGEHIENKKEKKEVKNKKLRSVKTKISK
jgi:large subunit ribosomal protein L22